MQEFTPTPSFGPQERRFWGGQVGDLQISRDNSDFVSDQNILLWQRWGNFTVGVESTGIKAQDLYVQVEKLPGSAGPSWVLPGGINGILKCIYILFSPSPDWSQKLLPVVRLEFHVLEMGLPAQFVRVPVPERVRRRQYPRWLLTLGLQSLRKVLEVQVAPRGHGARERCTRGGEGTHAGLLGLSVCSRGLFLIAFTHLFKIWLTVSISSFCNVPGSPCGVPGAVCSHTAHS